MIYILEGPDGVGKSTLARAIADKSKGHILHCSWAPGWGDMRIYFLKILQAAQSLDWYQDVVIDRWAPSEKVYGEVFRGGAQFDTVRFILDNAPREGVKWVICRHPNAVENHLKHKEERDEMFDDMTKIVDGFDKFVEDTSFLKWIEYDYTKVSTEAWVSEHVKKRM